MKTSNHVIISACSLCKIYRMGEVDVPALRNATIDICEGEFLIIVGPSGSGKSTLLHLIGGMARPTSGLLKFMDFELSKASDRELTLYRRKEIGFVFQFYNLVPTLTAIENVEVATEIAEKPMSPLDALKLVELEDRQDHFPSQLSGGQQQRVAIARAIAGNPTLILCDEPTGALDSETSRHVLELLCRLNKELKKTVVVITHNSAIAALGNRVARIHDGTIADITINTTQVSPSEVRW